ncbi:nucleotide sugar dehydrogenase [Bosea minatitlanensis]
MNRIIAVVGLGYVGLPVAVAFGRSGARVIGFDIDQGRIEELRAGIDRTREVEPHELRFPSLTYTTDSADLKAADFFIVTVPTPIDNAKRPCLKALTSASETVGKALRTGGIVVYESTVYPGATEEECVPVLERFSGLKAGVDFFVGYSPERINPGDREHRFETIAKIVSGQNQETLDIVADVYGSVIKANVHKAPSIMVAEAAKVIENTQRDLNIALMNELSVIFSKLGIDTADVLAAAGTKWNFLRFTPGLVGGHCIGVDPYYLTHRAEMVGYHPHVILAGRRINDQMGEWIARSALTKLGAGRVGPRKAAVLGLTFKENVPDTRNTRVVSIVRELEAFGWEVNVHDPHADPKEVKHEYDLPLKSLEDLRQSEIVVLAVAHDEYVKSGWDIIKSLLPQDGKRSLVVDIKSVLDRTERPEGVELLRL